MLGFPLAWVCACRHSLRELMCASALLCLKMLSPWTLPLPVTLISFSPPIFWALKEEYDPTQGWALQSLFVSPFSPVVGLCAYYHLLQEDHPSDISCRQGIIIAFRTTYLKLWIISRTFHLMLLNHLTSRNQMCRQQNHRKGMTVYIDMQFVFEFVKSLFISGLKRSYK